ncbi:serine/threonine-protein kinase [Actinacidiphila acidipaludis]|uniref:non-specific serine/threonine protein kinase n=1 Tax=Actinacidiphila acidipaludis TaxID=2873382 RepID=A0ABS7Q2I5_9ACTN|nr:serine/threonine-protein kinase [Streptomyces acidipaludis]MBY8877342.1 protein kinase [Streptomyces acidipaludis]
MVVHGGQDGNHDVDLDGSGATPLTVEDPRQIGPYPLVGLLGAGGMGRVYLGVAEGRYAAVKRVLPVLAQDPDFLRHFNHELDNLARLPAGVSVPLLETGRTENPPWFATEYIPGLTLTEAVRLQDRPLPTAALWYLLRELAGRLRALHALDMLHRDVKPSNVMITLDGLALIDFGIARAADQSRLTRTGMVLGTPEYMAPEQAQGQKELSAAADVFALGSLLFFAATGASPFGSGSGLDVLYRIVHSEPDFDGLREFDPDLAAIVAACLDKSPSARPTAAELLERCAEGPEAAGAVWPTTVAEQLGRRAAFAAEVPALDELRPSTVALRSPAPVAAGLAAGEGAAAGQSGGAVAGEAGGAKEPPGAEAAAGGGESAKSGRRPEERRRRVLRFPVIVPIVLAAGGMTVVALLPDTSSSTDGKASDTPSVVLSTSPSSGKSASPARSSHPVSASASAHSAGKGAKPDSGAKQPVAGPAGGGGSASGGSGGSGGSSRTSGGTSGGGTSSTGGSSSSSGGSSSGGSSGGSGSTTRIGSAGTYRIRDASDGSCLEQDTSSGSPGSYAVNRSCSATNGSYAQWTFSPGPNGTFRVINKGSGSCLTAFMASGWINMDACGSNSGQYWRIGSTKSSGSTLESTTYSQCMEVVPTSSAKVTACDPADSAQLWGYAGKG